MDDLYLDPITKKTTLERLKICAFRIIQNVSNGWLIGIPPKDFDIPQYIGWYKSPN